ncbi:helix-turn-helix domain-containing protein [Williamsia sp. MIQD14]|jgi:excisionase family DNA binding protein|uniref:helix-turn-helix domain-containing protein n=1 Tax=Williamsia TaxID=85043 RepID=UPI0009EADF33|nr:MULTISPECIES: helix-turn-helix domain-containing protein [Williamsia]
MAPASNAGDRNGPSGSPVTPASSGSSTPASGGQLNAVGSGTQFLTVAEVAALMRVSKMTVYRLVHSGELPAVRVGRSFRVHAKAVHDYLETSYFDVG